VNVLMKYKYWIGGGFCLLVIALIIRAVRPKGVSGASSAAPLEVQDCKVGGPERKEFELKPNFLLRLFWQTPRLPHAISASPREPFIFISLGSGRQPLHGD
jgi:hypothetical protein